MAHTLLESYESEEGENLLPGSGFADPAKAERSLQKDIAGLVMALEQPPAEREPLDGFSKDEELLKLQSRTQGTELVWAEVRSDILSFYTSKQGDHITSHRICWVYAREVDKEDYISVASGNRSVWRITVFSRGSTIVLASDDDTKAKEWIKFFRSLMKAKYSTVERRDREALTDELMPMLVEQEKMKAKQYQRIMNTLSESGFFIEPKLKKELEGYLELRIAKKQWKKVYCVLFPDFFYMFLPKEKISVDTEPYDWIEINVINSIRPSKVANTIVLRTLLNRFTFKAKHDVAVAEWVNAIRGIRERQTGGFLAKMETHPTDKGYMYTRDIDGKVLLSWIDGKVKTKKLPKGKEAGIGRSGTNVVCLPEDKYISRAHAKIVIENNVPYCVDLGSSAGTKVNGKRITKEALKPGDVIQVGVTDLTVEIKDGNEIFVEVPKPQPVQHFSEEDSEEKPKKKKSKKSKGDHVELDV